MQVLSPEWIDGRLLSTSVWWFKPVCEEASPRQTGFLSSKLLGDHQPVAQELN
jgi:hypothetical protein